MINFNLIARPMQEMVGGSSLMMGYRVANIAALVIILVEVAMGLFLMESLRITRLFPVIASMKDSMRLKMVWITFGILLTLASVEAGLAYMREILAQDDAALRASLLSGTVAVMVGGSSLMMGYRVANIAALVIILVEVAMGLFLMESLRITRLFPVIASMKDSMRLKMVWITFGILLTLASVEAGLAYMREILAQDDAALRASLLSGTVAAMGVSDRWITTAAQMGMGFILPFALVFVAIPLESFIHSSRTVLGITVTAILRALAFVFALLANSSHYLGRVLISVYDIFIFIPLWIEGRVNGSFKAEKKRDKHGFHPLQTQSMKEISS